jgi:hypothetical protein
MQDSQVRRRKIKMRKLKRKRLMRRTTPQRKMDLARPQEEEEMK